MRPSASQRDDRVAPRLAGAGAGSRAYTPALRDEVLSAVVSQPDHLPGLLTAAGRRAASRPARSTPCAAGNSPQHRDPDVRRRAEALFGAVPARPGEGLRRIQGRRRASSPTPRTAASSSAASAPRATGSTATARPSAPTCSASATSPRPAILLHILAPDQEITPGFAAYTVATRDGRVLTGLIASETPTSLTLRQPLGKEDTILRAEIEAISAGKQSLMPQGLEKNISRQEFADLLAYLKGEGEGR